MISYAVVGHPTQVGMAICAHISRRTWADGLSEALSAPVALDNGSLGSLANHDQAWRLAALRGREWSLVLEDDTLICEDFEAHVSNALDSLPSLGVVSFYVGSGKPYPLAVSEAVDRATRKGASWLRSKRLYWGPAVAMPTSWVPRMLKAVERSSRPYDQRLSDWVFSTDTPVYYSNPSLVDHRDAPSTITDKPQPARRAVHYGEPAAWNSDAVYLGR